MAEHPASDRILDNNDKNNNNNKNNNKQEKKNDKAKKKTRNKKSSSGKKDPSSSSSSLLLKEQVKYYNRLLYTARKNLHKEAKTIRNFECQKIIRKIKDAKIKNTNVDQKDSSISSNSSSHAALDEQLLEMKRLDLELVVQESLRRLGILLLNPTPPTDDTTATATATSTACTLLVERLLKHKRMQVSLEQWNEKVTEYRRWSLKRQEQQSTSKFSQPPPSPLPANATAAAVTSTNKSLFVQLGGEHETDTVVNPYGPGADALEDTTIKKNRKGQRARRAKALAMEAQKAGKSTRAADSLNWRKPKTHPGGDVNTQNHASSTTGGAAGGREKSSNSKNQPSQPHSQQQQDESLHPSWAAKKKDAAKIVQFQGTKITFD